jgi:hypothetical protein
MPLSQLCALPNPFLSVVPSAPAPLCIPHFPTVGLPSNWQCRLPRNVLADYLPLLGNIPFHWLAILRCLGGDMSPTLPYAYAHHRAPTFFGQPQSKVDRWAVAGG